MRALEPAQARELVRELEPRQAREPVQARELAQARELVQARELEPLQVRGLVWGRWLRVGDRGR